MAAGVEVVFRAGAGFPLNRAGRLRKLRLRAGLHSADHVSLDDRAARGDDAYQPLGDPAGEG